MSVVGMAQRDVDQRIRVNRLDHDSEAEAEFTRPRALAADDPLELLERRVAKLETALGATAASRRRSALTTALSSLATYVPTEVITFYLAAAAAQPALSWLSRELLLGFFLVLAPLVVYAATVSANNAAQVQHPWRPTAQTLFNMGAATLSFLVWAYALPFTDSTRLDDPTGAKAVQASLAVVATAFFLGLIGDILSFKTPGSKR